MPTDAIDAHEDRAIGALVGLAVGDALGTTIEFKPRDTYEPITDTQALEAFQLCCALEGIIPALESSHALAALETKAREMGEDQIIVVNVSGRGDKDIFTVAEHLGFEL